MAELPPWKKSKVLAGAMMLLKGYVQPLAICDHCRRALERADQTIDVRFEDKAAHFDCPHCGKTSTRQIGKMPAGTP